MRVLLFKIIVPLNLGTPLFHFHDQLEYQCTNNSSKCYDHFLLVFSGQTIQNIDVSKLFCD